MKRMVLQVFGENPLNIAPGGLVLLVRRLAASSMESLDCLEVYELSSRAGRVIIEPSSSGKRLALKEVL